MVAAWFTYLCVCALCTDAFCTHHQHPNPISSIHMQYQIYMWHKARAHISFYFRFLGAGILLHGNIKLNCTQTHTDINSVFGDCLQNTDILNFLFCFWFFFIIIILVYEMNRQRTNLKYIIGSRKSRTARVIAIYESNIINISVRLIIRNAHKYKKKIQ